MSDVTPVAVILDSADFGPPRVIGSIRRAGRRGGPISFEFDERWLAADAEITLDPALGHYPGPQYPAGPLFGFLSDIAPDRWGRMLLQRQEAVEARRDGRPQQTLDEWDFLTRISDESRMGALRLRADDDFIGTSDPPVPPVARLTELQELARMADEGVPIGDADDTRQLLLLVAPGSSLGGARPKASFRADDGSLWLAKFPSATDRWNVGAWERVLNTLAGLAGITVPESTLLPIARPYGTFAARRFDRTPEERRRLYTSAMTLTRGSDHDPEATYVAIAEAIATFGHPKFIDADLKELFRRVVFNIATGHRDDHLRNHGFLGTPRGWRLAPAFDINPVPTQVDHAIGIDVNDHTVSLELAVATAPYYRLTTAEIDGIVGDVLAAVRTWRAHASVFGIGRDETEMMASVFIETR